MAQIKYLMLVVTKEHFVPGIDRQNVATRGLWKWDYKAKQPLMARLQGAYFL